MDTLNQLEPQQRRSLLVLFITGLLFWISIAILLPTLPAYLDRIGIDRQQLGLIIGAFAIGLLMTRPIVGKLVDTRGRKLVLLIGTAVAAIAPFGYLTVTSMPLLIAIRAFHGISIAAFTTAFSALVVDLAPPKQRGEIIGLMSLTNPLGVAIGPAIGGYLQVFSKYHEIFWISIICGTIAFIAASQLRESRIEIDLDHNESTKISIWQILTNPALSIPALVLLLIGFPFGAIHTFVPLQHFPVICSTLLVRKGVSRERGAGKDCTSQFRKVLYISKVLKLVSTQAYSTRSRRLRVLVRDLSSAVDPIAMDAGSLLLGVYAATLLGWLVWLQQIAK
jgi:MFS family permease